MRYIVSLSLLILISCKPSKKELTAQQIIDTSMKYSGVDMVENSTISFTFRGTKYKAIRKKGDYKLSKIDTKNDTLVTDILSNKGFVRLLNNKQLVLPDSMSTKYANAVNSVHYFSVLPFGLNDKAVKKKILPSSIVKGKEYYKIEVTFSENGGGEDFEDVFIYWIGKEDFLVDYLAYSYHTNGGGKRFRVLKEQCIKNGIRFVDYYNYKPLDAVTSLINIDKSYENNQLKKVSEIVLKDIEVEIF